MNNQRPNPKSRYHSDAFGSLPRTGLSLRMPVERARATVNTAQVPEFGRYWTSDRQSLGKSCDTSAPPTNARMTPRATSRVSVVPELLAHQLTKSQAQDAGMGGGFGPFVRQAVSGAGRVGGAIRPLVDRHARCSSPVATQNLRFTTGRRGAGWRHWNRCRHSRYEEPNQTRRPLSY